MDPTISCLQSQLNSSQQLIELALNEFKDEDYFAVLPKKCANAYWILGHLTVNEDLFLSLLTQTKRKSDPKWIEYFEDDFSCNLQDWRGTTPPLSLPKTAVLFRHFKTQSIEVKNALNQADPEKFNQAAPDGLPKMFQDKGAVWGIIPTHRYWHIGQIMSIRRMLDKPRLIF